MADNVKCSATVYREGSFRAGTCGRKAKVVENDKPYCGQHAPSAARARSDATRARWEREWAIDAAKSAVRVAESALVEGCVRANIPEARDVIGARRKLAELMNGGTT